MFTSSSSCTNKTSDPDDEYVTGSEGSASVTIFLPGTIPEVIK